MRIAVIGSLLLVAVMHAAKSRAGGDAGALGVRCIVPPRAEANIDYQAAQIAITANDVARGFIEVAGASRFTVRTNSRSGYLIDFFTRVPIFTSAHVRSTSASGGDIGADGGTMTERAPVRRGGVTEITYRFVLDKRVQPGVYPWPLAFAVRPL